jgi:hypothetical protein
MAYIRVLEHVGEEMCGSLRIILPGSVLVR